jgi:hypothetical protein
MHTQHIEDMKKIDRRGSVGEDGPSVPLRLLNPKEPSPSSTTIGVQYIHTYIHRVNWFRRSLPSLLFAQLVLVLRFRSNSAKYGNGN